MPTARTADLKLVVYINRDFQDYLTQQDWRELAELSHEQFVPQLSARLIAESHRMLDQYDLKRAFVAGVSGLEVALEEFVRQRLESNHSLIELTQSFWQLPLPTRLVSLTTAIETLSLAELELSVQAIKTRNRIVHEGWEPGEDAKPELRALLKTASLLIAGPRFKFPLINTGNALRPVEEWEKASKP